MKEQTGHTLHQIHVKITAFLLVLAMACTAMASLPVEVFAADGDFTIENGVLTKYNGSGGDVVIPNSVISIADDVFFCSSLTSVTIPNSVTSIGNWAFFGSNLTSVTIGNSVTSIGAAAFGYCGSLTSITVDGDNTQYSSLDGVLYNKNMTELLQCPGGKSGSFTIPNSVTSIGNSAFSGCRSMTSVTIPNSVTSIAVCAFDSCESLTSVTIPDSVTRIEDSVFSSCNSLTSVTVPKSITSIGCDAFLFCGNLTDIYYSGSKEEWNKVYIDGYNSNLFAANIHYNSNGSGEESSQDEDSITTIISVPAVVNHNYGVNTYSNTIAGDVYEDTRNLIKAMDDYFDIVQQTMQNPPKQNANPKKKTHGQILRQLDKSSSVKLLTMEATLPDDAEEALYEALAQYFDIYKTEAEDLGSIDMSADMISISASIVNKIRNTIHNEDLVTYVGNYKIKFDVTHYWYGAYQGSVTVKNMTSLRQYTGVMVSSPDDTAKALNSYINTLTEWEEDALTEALKSVFSDLYKVTGVKDMTQGKIKKILENRVAILRKSGYGDMLTYWSKIRKSYDICKKITNAKNAKDLSKALKNVNGICDELIEMDFSDNAVTNQAVKAAMKKLSTAKNKLVDSMTKYMTQNEPEEHQSLYKMLITSIVQCPVDVIVLDENGNLLGKTEGNRITSTDRIMIEMDGDVKKIMIPDGMKADIQFVGTGSGTMTYVVEQTQNGRVLGRANYYNIPLRDGITYSQSMPTDTLVSDSDLKLHSESDNKDYGVSEYLSTKDMNAFVTVNCEAETGGITIGGGNYPKGDPVVLIAQPESDYYQFMGWYIGGDLVETSEVYRFAAVANVNVTAKFAPLRVSYEGYGEEMAAGHETSAILIYKVSDTLYDIDLCMEGEECPESLTVKIEEYVNNAEQKTYEKETSFDGESRYTISSVELPQNFRLEIYDQADNKIGTVFSTDSIQLDKRIISLTMGEHEQLTVLSGDENTPEVTWRSSNQKVATVDSNGVVTAVAEGECVITAKSINGNGTDKCTVIVYDCNLTASPESPQKFATPITLTATGGSSYRFYYEQNGKSTTIRDFAAENTCVWTPTIIGEYMVYVDIMGESGKLLAVKGIKYTITDMYSFTLDKENEQNVGVNMTLTADGGSSYKFYYEYNGAWCNITTNTTGVCEWSPKYAGDYMLYVDIKDESGKTIACRTQEFKLNDPFILTSDAETTELPYGKTINFTAEGGINYKFYYEKQGEWVRVQDFSAESTCAWTPTAAGKYNFYCDIKDASGAVVACKRITFHITNPYSFTADKETAQPVGTKINFTATGGDQYKFYYEKDGSWARIQSFSTANTCAWTPTVAGRYNVYCDIAEENGTVLAYKGIEFVIGDAGADEYSFNTSVESPQPMNTVVTLTATGGTSYKFYYEVGGKWATIKNFSTANTATWTPDMIADYTLYVDIKNSSGKVVKTLSKKFSAIDPYSFTADVTSPQNIGKSVEFTATGGTSYKFYYQYSGAWVKIQDSTSATCNWKPNKAGEYMVYVDIKNASGTVVTCRTMKLEFNDPYRFTTSVGSLTQPAGTVIRLSATGGVSYKFYYEKNGKWAKIQDFSDDSTCTWIPTEVGKYNVYCDMKDSSGAVAVCKRITFNITEKCTFTASRTSASVGDTVALIATGGASYQFYYEKDGSWVSIQSFSEDNTCVWELTETGDYVVYVDINDASGNLIGCKGVRCSVK